nr:RNA-directed DNA polymerase, eukaryota [Tanacetum cinerariifolium]
MSNAMLNLMKKLKYLKKKIRAWNHDMGKYSKNSKLTFKAELENLDSIIDRGEGNDDIINKRMAVVKFERPKEARLNLNMEFPCKLTCVQQYDLEIDVSNDEIKGRFGIAGVVDAGLFKGMMLDSSMQLSHMFNADDAVFVGQWSDSNIDTIVHVLECFHRAFK